MIFLYAARAARLRLSRSNLRADTARVQTRHETTRADKTRVTQTPSHQHHDNLIWWPRFRKLDRTLPAHQQRMHGLQSPFTSAFAEHPFPFPLRHPFPSRNTTDWLTWIRFLSSTRLRRFVLAIIRILPPGGNKKRR